MDKILIHEDYKKLRPEDNDLAILKLKKPLVYGNTVGPACLPDPSFNPAGKIAVASGWGLTGQMPNTRPRDLMVRPCIH